MDKSIGSWALLSAVGIFIVLGTSIPGALLSMIISGTIPGTTYTLPLGFIMTIYPLIAILALIWITKHTMYIGEIEKPLKQTTLKKKTTHKTKLSTKKQPAVKRRPRTAV